MRSVSSLPFSKSFLYLRSHPSRPPTSSLTVSLSLFLNKQQVRRRHTILVPSVGESVRSTKNVLKGFDSLPSCGAQLFSTPTRYHTTDTSSRSKDPFPPSSTSRSDTRNKSWGHLKPLIWASILFLAGAAAYSKRESIGHRIAAVQRSMRVVAAVAVCINDYRVTLRHKADGPEAFDLLLKACHKRCAERTLSVMEKNGSVFIKLGQHLSSMNYILPPEWCETFIPLQDKCPVSSLESIEEMVLADTGRPLSAWFSEFEEKPIGAASLAQVHRATLRETGEKVAVKVQHPVLDEWSKLDIGLTSFTFKAMKRWFPEYDLTWLSEELQMSLPQELDFTHEARNANRVREYFSHIPSSPLVIPKVHWAQRRILVMDYVSGARLDDLDFLAAHDIDRDKVADSLAGIFNEMIFGRDAPLHCDPHGGNLAIRYNPKRQKWTGGSNFDIILYDHGLYRDIPLETRRSYARLWLAVLDADLDKMRKYAHEVAGIGETEFKLFASAITGKPFDAIRQGIGSASSLGRDQMRDHQKMSAALSVENGMLSNLILMLGRVPKVFLLILKTNDLTRSLCEGLKTDLGPIRSFLILGEYAARCAYEEEVEKILVQNGSGGSDGEGATEPAATLNTAATVSTSIPPTSAPTPLTAYDDGRIGSALVSSGPKWSVLRLTWPPGHLVRFVRAWARYFKIRTGLALFRFWLDLRSALGMRPLAA